MILILPKAGYRSRLLALAYGLVLLIWMGLEDSSMLPAAMIGTGFTALLVYLWLTAKWGGKSFALRWWSSGGVILGAAVGGASTLTIAGMMFFKTGWHGHAYPDFPPQMIFAMLSRLPVWMLAGLLIGLSVVLMTIAIRADSR